MLVSISCLEGEGSERYEAYFGKLSYRSSLYQVPPKGFISFTPFTISGYFSKQAEPKFKTNVEVAFVVMVPLEPPLD